MTPTLEDLLERDAAEHAQFCEDVQEVTQTEAGRRMIATLVTLAHPFRSPARATVEDTYKAIGQKEVVTLLWERASAQEFNPHRVKPNA